MSGSKESLTKVTGRALTWNYIGVFVRLVLGFGINVFLTRLLGPKPFGELAVALIVFSFGNLLSNVGVSSVLIQKQNLDDEDIRFCFTAQVLVGGFMALLLVVSAPVWARFFHDPGVTALLRCFAVLFLFQAFGTSSTALLNRKQDAKTLQIISICSYLVGYLFVGIPFAFFGAGIWSLVFAQLTQAFLSSVLSYAVVRHSLVPVLHPRHIGLLTFGFRVLGANICSWGISSLDNTVVGHMAGPEPLGLYSRAFNLAAMPSENIISSLLQILLPAFSRVQTDTEKLRQIYAATVGLVLLALGPISAAMAAAPDVVILGLYGRKWTGAIGIFPPLALALPINAAMALSGPLLTARGKPQRELVMQLISVIAAAVAYIIAIRYSLVALSWTVLAIYLLRFGLLTQAVNREIAGSWRDVGATVRGALLLSLTAAAVAHGIAAATTSLRAPIRLGLVVAGVAISVLACFFSNRRLLLGRVLVRFPQMGSLFPARLQWIVQE